MNQKRGGLFAVIEEVFYKSKYGPENHELVPQYIDSDQIRNESSYLYSTPETVNTSANQTVTKNVKPISDRSTEDLVHDKNSLGPVAGPEYPHRPILPIASLKPVSNGQRDIQPRKYDGNRFGNYFHPERRAQTKPRNKPYFKSHKKQYDPFAFQTTPRSTTKDHYLEDKRIFSNRLDSRFSIQASCNISSSIKLHYFIPGVQLYQLQYPESEE